MDLTHDWPTPLFIVSQTSSIPIGQSLEGQTESGGSPSPVLPIVTGRCVITTLPCCACPGSQVLGTIPMSIARQAGIPDSDRRRVGV